MTSKGLSVNGYTGYTQTNGAVSMVNKGKPHHSFVYTLYNIKSNVKIRIRVVDWIVRFGIVLFVAFSETLRKFLFYKRRECMLISCKNIRFLNTLRSIKLVAVN
jgi:hypothetical protein